MPVKNDREYRNFEMLKRAAQEGEEKDYIVEGYASTFDEYTLYDWGDERWVEQIDSKAFDEADISDVVFLLDHTGRVYARTKNGTVNLSVDAHGFFTETDLSKTDSARSVYEDIKAGNYTQMSFAFTVAEQHFDEYFEDRGDGKNIRIIKRVIDRIKKVYDISAVGFPANPNTDIGVATRAAFDGAIEGFEAERLSEKRAKQERAKKEAELKLKLLEVNSYD